MGALADFAARLAPEVLRGASLEVEAAGLPPVRIDLSELAADTPPGLLMRALRPRVTVRSGGAVLFEAAPAGAPEDGAPWPLIIAGGVVLGVGALTWLALR